MIFWIGKNRFNDDSVPSWNKSFGYNAKPFMGNRDHLPVNIFFPKFMLVAPVLVALANTSRFPISSLAVFRAVGPTLTATALLGREPTDFEAVSAVPYFILQ